MRTFMASREHAEQRFPPNGRVGRLLDFASLPRAEGRRAGTPASLPPQDPQAAGEGFRRSYRVIWRPPGVRTLLRRRLRDRNALRGIGLHRGGYLKPFAGGLQFTDSLSLRPRLG